MPFPLNPSPRRESRKRPEPRETERQVPGPAPAETPEPEGAEAPTRQSAAHLQRTFSGTACGSRSTRPTGTR